MKRAATYRGGRTRAARIRAAQARQAIIAVLRAAPDAYTVADIGADPLFQATKYPRGSLALQLRSMAENNLIRRTKHGRYLPPTGSKASAEESTPPARRPVRVDRTHLIAGPLTLNVDLLKQVDRHIRLEINGLVIDIGMQP